MFLGDFPEDFTTVTCMFTTHASTGAPVAPSSAFEAADVIIYKNGSGTQKTSTNGVTMTSPFDSITGLHCVVLDTSNDTGDGGFWVAGAQYTLVLSPDETVDGIAVAKVIGTFGIELAEVLRPTTAGRQLDVSAGGEAGIDWANIGSPTTAVNLSATNIDVDQVVASVSGAVGSVTGLTAADVAAIKAKTDNLPSDPADASVIGGRFDTIDISLSDILTDTGTTLPGTLSTLQTSVNDLPTNAELATVLGTADDAILAILGTPAVTIAADIAGISGLDAAGVRDAVGLASANLDTQLSAIDTVVDAVKVKTDSLTFTVAGQVDANIQYVNDVQVNGTGAPGSEWGP